MQPIKTKIIWRLSKTNSSDGDKEQGVLSGNEIDQSLEEVNKRANS